MSRFLRKIWLNEEGQDIAGYPVMSLIASGDVLFNGRATSAHHVTWVWDGHVQPRRARSLP